MRHIWKGTISFGLINIPVALYKASVEQEVKFTLLHEKDLSTIRYARICKEEDKEIPYEEIVKGYKKNGQFKILQEEDFKKIEKEKSKTMEIAYFCNMDEVDSIYYMKPYYVKPEKGGEKAYFLLLKALNNTDKVAIVNFTFKNHNHLGLLKPYKNTLILNELRFNSQILPIEKAPGSSMRLSAAEVDIAEQLISQLSKSFKPNEFKDTYVFDLKRAISKKSSSKIVTKKEQKRAKVYDIMTLLKESLDEKNVPVKKRAGKK